MAVLPGVVSPRGGAGGHRMPPLEQGELGQGVALDSAEEDDGCPLAALREGLHLQVPGGVCGKKEADCRGGSIPVRGGPPQPVALRWGWAGELGWRHRRLQSPRSGSAAPVLSILKSQSPVGNTAWGHSRGSFLTPPAHPFAAAPATLAGHGNVARSVAHPTPCSAPTPAAEKPPPRPSPMGAQQTPAAGAVQRQHGPGGSSAPNAGGGLAAPIQHSPSKPRRRERRSTGGGAGLSGSPRTLPGALPHTRSSSGFKS